MFHLIHTFHTSSMAGKHGGYIYSVVMYLALPSLTKVWVIFYSDISYTECAVLKIFIFFVVLLLRNFICDYRLCTIVAVNILTYN